MDEFARLLLMLIQQNKEIAIAEARNQNAPGYMYRQAEDLQDQILQLAAELEARNG